MGCLGSSRCPVCVVFLLAALSGCQALHRYRDVTVLARDADTGMPIPGAEVRFSYPHSQQEFAPWVSAGPTGGDGTARLRAAPYGELDVALEASAAGYLPERKSVPVEVVQAIDPPSLFGSAPTRAPHFTLLMYSADPRPTVELVVTTGYRGEVAVEVMPQERAAHVPGQRQFRFPVPPSGVVQAVGPPLLAHVTIPSFTACYADGTPIPREAKGPQVGFWFLQSGDRYLRFLVGTQVDFATQSRTEEGEGRKGSSVGGSGKGGGRGRRGGSRGGNQPPSDAGS